MIAIKVGYARGSNIFSRDTYIYIASIDILVTALAMSHDLVSSNPAQVMKWVPVELCLQPINRLFIY